MGPWFAEMKWGGKLHKFKAKLKFLSLWVRMCKLQWWCSCHPHSSIIHERIKSYKFVLRASLSNYSAVGTPQEVSGVVGRVRNTARHFIHACAECWSIKICEFWQSGHLQHILTHILSNTSACSVSPFVPYSSSSCLRHGRPDYFTETLYPRFTLKHNSFFYVCNKPCSVMSSLIVLCWPE